VHVWGVGINHSNSGQCTCVGCGSQPFPKATVAGTARPSHCREMYSVEYVDVPASTVEIFSIRPGGGKPPRAPAAEVAESLGLKGIDDLRAAVSHWWSAWGSEDAVSPLEFVSLIQMLQFKTAKARSLAEDLRHGGINRVVTVASEGLGGLAEDAADEEASPTKASSTTPSECSTPTSRVAAELRELSLRSLAWASCAPEEVGMDREPLEKCRRYLHYRISRKHFAGIVGGVVKNGKLVYFDEAGYADLATKTPMRQDTLIRLFSMTKCLVVAAFMTYAEDPSYGIDLEDPVWKYIPSFKKLKLRPKYGSDKPRDLESKYFEERSADGKVTKTKLPTVPTLRHLLTHTAGLGYGPTIGDSIPPKNTDHYKIYFDLVERAHKGEIVTLEEWIDQLAQIPLKSNPGSYWEYSFATDVLGRILEVISGKPLDKAVEEKVCGPLGMADTGFHVPPEKAHRLGAFYRKRPPVDEKGNEKVAPGCTYNLEVLDQAGKNSGYVGNNVSKILSGGGTIEVPLSIKGGMVSTFRDYLRFLLMLRNFGELDGVRILRRETVQTMICNQMPAATGRRAAWVFDKKGQGYNFLGQIQVQHNEKETWQEKGELKRGGQTYASLAPGTTSAEYGWGGLGGPAFTIDPRQDIIVLSMTQTALELDHEENLRFSARRSIHSGIFGVTAGPSKVTDYPPEFHEGLRNGKLIAGLEKKPKKAPIVNFKPLTEAELNAFVEADQQAARRPKNLKELVVQGGNVGHEVQEEDEDMESADGNKSTEDQEGAGKRPLNRSGSSDSGADAAERKAKQAKLGEKDATSTPVKIEADKSDPLDVQLFSRVSVPGEDILKARVTGVNGNDLEIITEAGFQTLNVGKSDVALIDETQIGIPIKAKANNLEGPKDFGFLMPSNKEPATPNKVPNPSPHKNGKSPAKLS